MNPTIVNQAVMTIDRNQLIATLRKAFAGKQSVVQELAQNARRAGSDLVRFYTADDNTLVVKDNGCGILDFGKLISIATSDWNSEIKGKESAYGCGFMAALFNCEHIVVKSKGMMIDAKCEEILEAGQVNVMSYDSSGDDFSTSIALTGGNIIAYVQQALEESHPDYRYKKDKSAVKPFSHIFAGFPIMVFLCGQEIDRNHALSTSVDYYKTDVGHVKLCRILRDKSDHVRGGVEYLKSTSVIYFQGFCVHTPHGIFPPVNSNIVHLDETKFDAVAPDRHCLIDEKDAITRIDAAVLDLIKNDIVSMHKLHGDDFILDSIDTLNEFGMQSLLNGIDKLPAEAVAVFSDYPTRNEPEDETCLPNNLGPASFSINHILRSEIEGNIFPILSCDVVCDKMLHSDFLFAMYCWLNDGILVIADYLDDQHWIFQYLSSISEIQISANNLREPSSYCSSEVGQPMLCDHYQITGPNGTSTVTDHSISLFDRTFIPNLDNSSYVIQQARNFYPHNEYEFEESKYDNISKSYNSWLMSERLSHEPAELIKSLLKDLVQSMPALKNKSFNLQITDNDLFVTSV